MLIKFVGKDVVIVINVFVYFLYIHFIHILNSIWSKGFVSDRTTWKGHQACGHISSTFAAWQLMPPTPFDVFFIVVSCELHSVPFWSYLFIFNNIMYISYNDLVFEDNSCDPPPCLNNATCIPTGEANFTCDCVLRYSGDLCES